MVDKVKQVALETIERRRMAKADFKEYRALVSIPGNISTGFPLPANADLYIQSPTAIASATAVLTVNATRSISALVAANVFYHVGRFNRAQVIKKAAGAPAIRVYVMDGIGAYHLIGQ